MTSSRNYSMDSDDYLFDERAAARALDRAARMFNEYAVIERDIADRLFERLNLMKINPTTILDCGARAGYTTSALHNHFPNAEVIGLELGSNILKQAKKRKNITLITSSLIEFPFLQDSFDLIFSNVTLHKSPQLEMTLYAWHRLLKPDGLLLFSTLGPDTLQELRQSFKEEKHVHPFMDMHHLGDLLQQNFLGPVMETEYVTVYYVSVMQLLREIKSTGAQNILTNRLRGLLGKDKWHAMLNRYEAFKNSNTHFPATLEIVYGHAWKGKLKNRDSLNQESESIFPVSALKLKKE